MELSYLTGSNEKEWDEYVLSHANSTIFHLTGWKNIIQRTYGLNSQYLIAKENNIIKGVLPLFLNKSLILGNKMVSIPYAPYGGILGDDDNVENFLLNAAIRLTKDKDSKYLEIRTTPRYRATKNSEKFDIKSMYMSSILELNSNSEAVLQKSFSRNKRKSIYKSQKQDLEYSWTSETRYFYDLFVANMTKLGSPSHPEHFFKSILSQFPENSRILLVKKNDKVVYAAFYFFYKNTLINSWSSTIDEYRHFYATDFGIWNAIQFGCQNGYKYYDFGRSQIDSSNLEFKRRWGAKNAELFSIFYLNKCTNVPNFTSSSLKRQLFSDIWKRVPLSIASSYGSYFRKKIL